MCTTSSLIRHPHRFIPKRSLNTQNVNSQAEISIDDDGYAIQNNMDEDNQSDDEDGNNQDATDIEEEGTPAEEEEYQNTDDSDLNDETENEEPVDDESDVESMQSEDKVSQNQDQPSSETDAYNHNKISLAEFPLLVELFHLCNKLYNEKKKLVPYEIPEREIEKIELGLRKYDESKRVIEIMTSKTSELREEVNLLFNNIEHLEIDEAEVLNLFAVSDYFKTSLEKLNVNDPVIYDVENDLEYLVIELTEEIKGFMSSIHNIRFIDSLIVGIAEPFYEEIQDDDDIKPVNKLEKNKIILKLVLSIKESIDSLGYDLRPGINFLRNFRKKTMDIVYKLDPNIPTEYSGIKIDQFKEAYCDNNNNKSEN